MSLLAHGVIAIALLGNQDGKGDPNQKQDASLEDQVQVLLAVRQETEQRDFKKALETWTSVKESAAKAGNSKLVVKAELGQARCLHALGKREEAIAMARAVLAVDPKNAEATSAVAKFLAGGQDDDDLNMIVHRLADVALSLTSPQEDERIKSARSELVRMSDVAVPQLAEFLRDNRVGVVDGTAYILVQMLSERSFAALSAAMKDPRCRYPKVLVDQATGVAGEVMLPFMEATLTRTEPELRRWAADRLAKGIGRLATETQVEVATRLLADPDQEIRRATASHTYSTDVARLLVAIFQPLVDAKDESSLQLGLAFLNSNRETLPPDVVGRWSGQLAQCPIASVRIMLLDADYTVASQLKNRTGDSHRRARVLLRILSDGDVTLFAMGAAKITIEGSFRAQDLSIGAHDGLLAALKHAIELPGIDLEKRYVVLAQLPLEGLSDEELFGLFNRLAVAPADADADWRASTRERIAMEILRRKGDGGGCDAFAAKWLLKIADGAGMRQWLTLTQGRNTDGRQTALEAVKADDVVLRTQAYRVFRDGVPPAALPHLAEDLRNDDPAVVLAAVRAIGWGEQPELVAPLRRLLAADAGELHVAALRALAKIGGKEAADELLAAMKATPKDGVFEFLRELERGTGAERLSEELVAVAQAHGSSERVVSWMTMGGNVNVSPECASAFVRRLPEPIASPNLLRAFGSCLPPDVLTSLICRRLRNGSGYELQEAARLAGHYHIEAAWPDLVALLETGVGDAREAAMVSLKQLKEYRELRRTFAADDSDARRAAFDKALMMTKSKNAEQRAGAAIALAATGDVAAISPLLDLLGDGDEAVKIAARKALEKLADRAVVMPVDGSKAGADKSGEKGGDGEKGKKKAGN